MVLPTPLAGIVNCIVCGVSLVRFHGLLRLAFGVRTPTQPLYWCEAHVPRGLDTV